MSQMTLFSWGYYGWGNHTPKFVQAVDAVETDRGFLPPIFVDIRIRRSVRAKGFTGTAFEKFLGPARHLWMKSLGNRFIETRVGPNIQIADPSAAEQLLDLAILSGEQRRRLLFFCSCEWPRCDGAVTCHRTTVAELVLEAAKRRALPLEVVEWPGGAPKKIDLEMDRKDFIAVRNGRTTVPLGRKVELAAIAGLAWGSIAALHSGDESLHRVVGPAVMRKDDWALPILFGSNDASSELSRCEQESSQFRQQRGLEAARV